MESNIPRRDPSIESSSSDSDSESDVSTRKSDIRYSRSSVDSESEFGFPQPRFRAASDSFSDDAPPQKRLRHSMSSMESATGDDTTDDTDHTDRETHQSSDADDAPSYSNMVVPRKEVGYTDTKAAKMMEKMGYRAGHGLGKNAQGRVEPVEVSKQRGRRGLGLVMTGLEPANLEWKSEKEIITVEEKVDWLENKDNSMITPESDWIEVGDRKLTIDDETKFCSPRVVRDILTSKTTFDELDSQELRKAVGRSNPFETIRGGIFLNRAAMKMANMDRVFDFMFTKPKHQDGTAVLKGDELLYFADVCAGPGGFSEYVLWRHKWKARGFGFTLKGDNDFKLSDFFAGPCESFEPHYGVRIDDDEGNGDVYDPKNQEEFRKFVLENTDGSGVHFMMADGGFSVEGQENIQEILSKQLYLCQFLMALLVVRPNGHFVCKIFDLFTSFSVGLVYLMYKAFSVISIHKPNTSRPANSERYIICKWKRPDCDQIIQYMSKINHHLLRLGTTSKKDIRSIVPLSVMEQDEDFLKYIHESNNRWGEQQIMSLQKVIAFCRDTSLEELRQSDMKKACLLYWGVPADSRKAPTKYKPDEAFSRILSSPILNEGGKIIEQATITQSSGTKLTVNNMVNVFNSIYNWHCTVLSNPKGDDSGLTFFLGLGRGQVFYLQGTKWCKMPGLSLELSANTLLLGEIVKEIRGERQRQVRTTALHIVDAVCLGGVDIRHLHITERVKQCELFAKAMNKPSRIDHAPIHVRELFELENIHVIANRLHQRVMKNNKVQQVFDLERGDTCIVPEGLIFFNGTQAPWNRHISRSTLLKYYYHAKTKKSLFDQDRPKDACKSFGNSYAGRAVCWWGENNSPHMADIMEFVFNTVK